MNSHPLLSQPAYIRAINRIGKHLEKAGLAKPDLSPDRLLVEAKRRTGLHDFGVESFRTGLDTLTAELQDHAQLSQIGRIAAHFNLLDHLSVRLQVIDLRARRPEIAAQQIQQPLFITGLPRTGTTILYELIAQDPDMRSPASWEVARPIPPAQQGTYDTDKRIKSIDRLLSLAEKLSPGLKAIHAIGARLPQECVYIFASHFISEQFSYMYNIPGYQAWALDQDMTESYRWHAHFLQHLQVDSNRARWVLKTPSHLAYLKYLLAQYPDAAIVWTHRQPLDAISSFSSLATTLRRGFSDAVDPMAIGAQEFGHYSRVTGTAIEQRRLLNPDQFFDVGFSDICSDPLSAIRSIYRHFDFTLSDEAETRMREYLQHHPRNLYGEHQYSSDRFGLDALQERNLYADYTALYGNFLQLKPCRKYIPYGVS